MATVELPQADSAAVPEEHLPRIPYDVYEPGAEIGRGGLGRVIRAVDRRLRRPVAIKELLPERRASERRFAREAFITARLEHPSIVSVHEAGRWPNGQPFYAMKLIAGRSLAEAIKSRPTLAARLELIPRVTAAAEAIAYAHAQRIIHRDIKPENVIVGDYGETVVIDWGLAKVLGEVDDPSSEGARPGKAGDTVAGAVLGTPAYMAPEQARADVVDARADVYSLGAVLYHVLAGAAPYRTPRRGPSSSAAPPPAPTSTVREPADLIEEVLRAPPAPLPEHVAHAPRDLVTIVEKAMARDRDARYPTAREMADDLLRFQTGQLVSARHYSPAALLRRWIGRHRAAVLVAGSALAILAAGGALAIRRIVVARGEAETRRNELILAQARGALERDPTAAVAWLAQLPPEGDWAAAGALAADAASRGLARAVWRRHAAGVWQVAVAPDGRHAASASADGTVVVHDLAGGPPVVLAGHAAEVNAVTWDAAGARLASGGDDGRILIWRDGMVERTLSGHEGSVTGVAFSPDGGHLYSIGYDRSVRVWDLGAGSGRVLGRHNGKGQALALSPDGAALATVATGDPLTVWDLAHGEARRAVGATSAGPRTVAFSPDGRLVAVPAPAQAGGSIVLYALDGSTRQSLPGDAFALMAIAFSADGKRLAASGTDKIVRVWDLGSGTGRWLAGHDGSVTSIAFTPGGDVVSGSGDRSVRLWRVPSLDERIVTHHEGGVTALAVRGDGALISGGADGVVRAGDEVLASGLSAVAAVAADGATVVAGCNDGSLHVLGGEPADVSGGGQPVVAIAVRAGAVAWTGEDETLHLRLAGRPDAELPAPDADSVIFTPDGATLLWTSASELRTCAVADCAATARTVERQRAWIRGLAVSPDGALVASGGGEGALHVADRQGSVRVLAGHESSIANVAFSPDGRHLATGARDGEVRLWDLAAGRSETLRGHARNVAAIAFSPDGRRLASVAADRTGRIWDMASGRSRLLLGHEDRIDTLAFTAGGATLATGSRDGTVRLWKADPEDGVPSGPDEMRRWVKDVTTAAIGRDGVLATPEK